MMSNGKSESEAAIEPFIEYALDDDRSTSVSIVEAIAASEGVSPADLQFTLYEYVNPDALDALCDCHRSAGNFEIELTIDRYRVRIDSGDRFFVSLTDQ